MRQPCKWFVSPAFDLAFIIVSWVFPASILLSMLFVQNYRPILVTPMIAIVYLIFTAFFDAPHIFQTLSRTHFDSIEFVRRRRLHLLALPICLLIAELCDRFAYANFFYLFLYFYGSWHITKQNIGFIRLYQRMNFSLETRFPKLEIYFSYLVFLYFIFHEQNAVEQIQQLTLFNSNTIKMIQLFTASLMIVTISGVAFLNWRVKQRAGDWNTPKLLFLFGVTLFFVLVSHTHFPLLFIVAITTISHDIQYQAWMWQYHRASRRHPRSGLVWLFTCTALGFLLFAAGDILHIILPVLFTSQIGIIYSGFVFWHYFIDGKIWKFSSMPELSVY